MNRLTSAQKARRRGRNRRGGKTRQQRVREKINRKRRRLREDNLKELTFHGKPVSKHADQRGKDRSDFAVYGIYEDGNEWVLTGLSATDKREKMSRDRTKISETEVVGRYIILPSRGSIDPTAGIEIDRFDTKKSAMTEISADGSNRRDTQEYVVRPEHNPTRMRVEVDRDDFQQFRKQSYKVWD